MQTAKPKNLQHSACTVIDPILNISQLELNISSWRFLHCLGLVTMSPNTKYILYVLYI